MRQALAGMLWSKQYYEYDVRRWLQEHRLAPDDMSAGSGPRNAEWLHLVNADIMSMPDTWEYPWFAAWDLAFHTVALGVVDPDFARAQLRLLLRELYLHPNGQLPAYEWNFSDVNPPVHAWASLFAFGAGRDPGVDEGDLAFLGEAFQKLAMNFSWWVNRKDARGRNVYQGGFLGLDNIGLFDRSAPLPLGGTLEQADGTAWMALYALNMLEMTLELSARDPAYAEMAVKFAQHFFSIAAAMDRVGDHEDELWDEDDGFFYDVLRFPDGRSMRLKVRSMVGLLPLCAVTVIPGHFIERYPAHGARIRALLERQPDLLANLPSPYSRVSAVDGCWRSSTSGSCDGSWPGCSTPPSSCRRTASARCRRPMPSDPSRWTWAVSITRSPTRRPNHRRRCSAATRTGEDRSGSRSTC